MLHSCYLEISYSMLGMSKFLQVKNNFIFMQGNMHGKIMSHQSPDLNLLITAVYDISLICVWNK
jgi:hypothetical protein